MACAAMASRVPTPNTGHASAKASEVMRANGASCDHQISVEHAAMQPHWRASLGNTEFDQVVVGMAIMIDDQFDAMARYPSVKPKRS